MFLFLFSANYDWLLNEPEGQASSYLTDLIAFLKSTFEAFTNLPVCHLLILDSTTYFLILCRRTVCVKIYFFNMPGVL